MLNYNEIKRGKVIVLNDEPYRVLTSNISKKNRNKPHNQTKIKSIASGKTLEKTFHASDKVNEAVLERQDIKYLYIKKNEVWFCVADNPKDRFFLELEDVQDQIQFLKQNDIVTGLYFNEKLIDLSIPPKVALKVKEAPGAVKGNTATGATKKIVLENGLEIQAPLFVEEGDTVFVNTETATYSERKKE
ncbi:hypothetical protein CSB11_01865 [Candidatus Campbellbacteria bacterium]|nr:MAG: hypothetical protein CSB11_01865 [Candidatus Campbellbacteria bacterium]